MKILYVCGNERSQQFPWLIDYQNDSLLYGLKELYGDDVVDCNRKHNLYWDYSDEDVATEYGKGFTFTRLLESDNCDREDIVKKIKKHYYDLVIYGSIWRNQDHIELVFEHYKPWEVVLVDGEDTTDIHEAVKLNAIYAKRECTPERYQSYADHLFKILPVSFSFPTKKVNMQDKKERKLAHSDPTNRNTYVFKTEADYYMDYRFSKFAKTVKKAGWDSLRHYEIMGNGCVPLFIYMADCPRYTMHRFPKSLLTKIIFFMDNDSKWLDQNYDVLRQDLMDHFLKFNTTEAHAKWFLKDVSLYKQM